MIGLKKVYGDELLRLALVLSLLKTDPGEYLQQESLLITAGLPANGSDWSPQHEPRTLLRPTFVHPKSLDHTLMDYERWLFEELHSLGRYHDRLTRDTAERMSNLNTLHTYLVNNVATDTVAPSQLEPVAQNALSQDEQNGVPDDADPPDEVKVAHGEGESEEPKGQEEAPPRPTVTVSPAALHNTSEDIFTDIQSRSFDVSEFLVTPTEMRYKREPEADTSTAVKDEPDRFFSDDAIDDFVPYFEHKSESDSLLQQNSADLLDYDETMETLRDFRSQLDYLDVKQQQHDLEQYLLENQPLEFDEGYELAPLLGEELVLDVKRERASTSTSEASSSGVSEIDNSELEMVQVKQEAVGEELTQEDMDLIEVLWKQDVDMGFCLEAAKPVEKVAKAAPEISKAQPVDEKPKPPLPEPADKQEDPWASLSYTVDTETGEYILQGELPSELVVTEDSRFDLLEEALKLVELGAPREQPDVAKQERADGAAAEPVKSAEEPREETEMLHPGMHAHHHPLAAYHHQSIMRQMSAEQRWQDLASLLSVPPPPPPAAEQSPYHQPAHHYHHPHNMGSGGYAHAHAHNAHYAAAALAPPPPHPDKHDNYGAAGPLDGGYKVESQQHDALYYQHGQGGGAEMAGNSDGLLQAILSDDDLQLVDMAMNEGMYTMRMLDGGGAVHAPHAPHLAAPSHMMTSHERESLSDSAVSSMGSERVASLSDGEWCDNGSDSAQDLHSSKFRPYDSGMCRGGAGAAGGPGERAPPQKKHHMFGKRCFQESPPTSIEGGLDRPVIKFEYGERAPYLHQHQICPGEYNARVSGPLAPQHAQLAPIAQPALHLHGLASSPHLLPSGAGGGDAARYGYADRVRHNHTYSAPHPTPDARPLLRDKRVRRLTDGSASDSGSSSGHASRDEKRARALGIPLAVHDIINLPMDEFNERLSKHDLSEAQLSLIRDIRRRGKNKVAAQNCRKRKLDQITSLADEVRTVRDRKQRLQRDQQSLLAERQRVKERFAALYRHVFQNLRDAEGRPVSSAQYSLQQAADGNVVLVPKMHSTDQHRDDDIDRKKHFDQ